MVAGIPGDGCHYAAFMILRNGDGVHALLDDFLSAVSSSISAQVRAILRILPAVPHWQCGRAVTPTERAWNNQRDGSNCGLFALVHLHRRLREVWAGSAFEPAEPALAAKRRAFLRQLFIMAGEV